MQRIPTLGWDLGFRDPSIQTIPTLGPRVCRYCLHWADWIPWESVTSHLSAKLAAGPLGVNEYLGRGIFKLPGKTVPSSKDGFIRAQEGNIGIMEKQMETTIVCWGNIGIMEKKMETTIVYWGNIGIMEKKMETTIVYWGNIGIMEKKMETTIVYWGNIGIMEKKMETTTVYWGNIGIMENKMEAKWGYILSYSLNSLQGGLYVG